MSASAAPVGGGARRQDSTISRIWSVAAVLHGFAGGKWSLAACRGLLGLGEPGNWPAAAKSGAIR